ncbi:unnamed protein product [Nezara viridula]|uniref:Neuropeptide n=1 Tax=Nezara viridula TaxID=85310 RepID=A0A9P0MUA7_NEZVI|nr:unnamed protein product [Nezara viridula]
MIPSLMLLTVTWVLTPNDRSLAANCEAYQDGLSCNERPGFARAIDGRAHGLRRVLVNRDQFTLNSPPLQYQLLISSVSVLNTRVCSDSAVDASTSWK